jgi:hypothetical protein
MLSLLLSISLASCSPIFKNPIPPPSELKADRQILGTWVRTPKVGQNGSKEQLSIFQRGSGWIDVVYIYDIDNEGSADGINVLIFEGYSTSVNKEKFLCLRFREKDFNWAFQKIYSRGDQKVGSESSIVFWIIVNYETPSNDELIIKHFSIPKVEELIKKGKLKRELVKNDILKGQPLDKVLVTSSSDELVDVISREGVGAFIWEDANDALRDIHILVFSRIKP